MNGFTTLYSWDNLHSFAGEIRKSLANQLHELPATADHEAQRTILQQQTKKLFETVGETGWHPTWAPDSETRTWHQRHLVEQACMWLSVKAADAPPFEQELFPEICLYDEATRSALLKTLTSASQFSDRTQFLNKLQEHISPHFPARAAKQLLRSEDAPFRTTRREESDDVSTLMMPFGVPEDLFVSMPGSM